MANTLTGLLPTLYDAIDVVSRELVGFIPAVTRNSSAERVAKDETVTFPIAPASTVADITPGLYAPDTGDQTIATATLTINKSRYAPVRWNGEEMRGVNNTGQLAMIMRDQFAQAMRALCNEVELDLAALYTKASGAYGVGGTAPFPTAADFSDFAGIQQVLDERGCPPTDRHLVLGSAAIANLRGKQSVLYKANEAGTTDLLRRGIIGDVLGLQIHNSGQVKAHTKGTATTPYIINSTTMAIGTTALVVDTGAGVVVAGDVVVFSGDTGRKYVILTGTSGSGTTLALSAPGLRVALADNATITLSTSYAANMCFHRSAIQLVTRAPAMPDGGDTADDVTEVVDPISGLAFQIAMYRQYRQVKFEVGLAWGVAATKSDNIALLIG